MHDVHDDTHIHSPSAHVSQGSCVFENPLLQCGVSGDASIEANQDVHAARPVITSAINCCLAFTPSDASRSAMGRLFLTKKVGVKSRYSSELHSEAYIRRRKHIDTDTSSTLFLWK